MKFLENYNFTKEEIDEFLNNTPQEIIDTIKEIQPLVEKNLDYLTKLGIDTSVAIFTDYPDIFFMDHTNFTDIFEKYDRESLVEKLNKNYKIVEYL